MRGDGEHGASQSNSQDSWADNEEEGSSRFRVPKLPVEQKCVKCHSFLETKARYCRQCYERRQQWMPARPTRKLRKRPSSWEAVEEEKEGESKESLFRLRRRTSKESAPLSRFTNVPGGLKHLPSRTSSESELDYEEALALERTNRRLYMEVLYQRKAEIPEMVGESSGREEESEEEEEEEEERGASGVEPCCLKCRRRPRDAIVVHGKTAHKTLCHSCATALKRENAPCPQCGAPVQFIVKEGFI